MDFPTELSWQARWTVALLLLDSACRKSLRLDVVCLNVALSACAKGGRWRVAVQLMQRFSARRLVPDALSLSSLTSSFVQRSNWRKALQLLDSSSPTAISAALTACAVAIAWPSALQLFVTAGSAGHGSVRNALLGALAAAKRWEMAMELMQVPSDRALLPVLSSLVRLRRWRQALRLLPQRGANAAALALTSAAATAQPVGEIRKEIGRIPSFQAFDINQRREVSARLLLRPLLPASCYPLEFALARQITFPAESAFLTLRKRPLQRDALRSTVLQGTSDLGPMASRDLWRCLSLTFLRGKAPPVQVPKASGFGGLKRGFLNGPVEEADGKAIDEMIQEAMKTSPASKSAAYSYAVAGREHAKEELGGCMLCLEPLPNDPREVINLCASELGRPAAFVYCTAPAFCRLVQRWLL
ncbi:unnamed protein product [Cladocopium goreaui]|uniref:Pentatricopeptide repeat-containing protein At1g64583, mitochondrial n=1 Tax=Cladocopium goreaui TaxID=2562237 RepID=A0A9P1FFA6_9DINO|nr:unnamed protein product [Cladocopium goreaui]